jgi:lysophospholipase L1-like esterase
VHARRGRARASSALSRAELFAIAGLCAEIGPMLRPTGPGRTTEAGVPVPARATMAPHEHARLHLEAPMRVRPRALVLMAALQLSVACVNLGTPAEDAGQGAGTPSAGAGIPSTPDGLGGGAMPSEGAQGSNTGGAQLAGGGVGGSGALPSTGGGTANNGNAAPTAPAAPTYVPVTGPDRFTWVGRFNLANPDAVPFTFLSSKVGVRFTGTSIAMDLSSVNTDGFNVVLDGNALPPLRVAKGTAVRYPIASGLAEGTHVLWLTKRTEFNQAGNTVMTLHNLVLDANATFLTPPAPRARRIEAIGDSGFAGYGVDGLYVPGNPNFPQCPYSIPTQNGDLSVPSHVARALDAEVINLSWSGRAVVSSQFDSNPTHQLPVIHEQLVGNNPALPYDFKQQVDVVILSGGANDFIGTSGSGTVPDINKFVQTYTDWLLRVRGHYPRATIVAAVGANAKQTDRTSFIDYLKQAVQRAQAATPAGDPNILFFDYFANDPNGWTNYSDVAGAGGLAWGCNYHPSVAGSAWLANRLVAAIRPHMGW